MAGITVVRSTAPTLLTKTASDPGQQVSFTLDALPGYTDFTSMYDYYKIVRVDLHVTAVFNGVVTSKLYVTTDFDGGAVLSLADMAQRRHVERVLSPDHPEFTFSLRPRVAASVGTTAGTALSSLTNGWLDLASSTIVHYGVAYNILNYNTGITGVNIYTSETYHVRLAGLR